MSYLVCDSFASISVSRSPVIKLVGDLPTKFRVVSSTSFTITTMLTTRSRSYTGYGPYRRRTFTPVPCALSYLLSGIGSYPRSGVGVRHTAYRVTTHLMSL